MIELAHYLSNIEEISEEWKHCLMKQREKLATLIILHSKLNWTINSVNNSSLARMKIRQWLDLMH